VLLDPGNGEAMIEESAGEPEPRRMSLPAAITLDVVTGGAEPDAGPPWRIAFHSSGSLAGRSVTIVISTDEHSQSISVASATGAVLVR
jgi:hypothetical protein